MPAKSNLAEVNLAVCDYIFDLLSTWIPDEFTEGYQVIYTPTIDQPTDFRQYEKRLPNPDELRNENVQFPFAAVTRQDTFSGFLDKRAIPSRNFIKQHYLPGQLTCGALDIECTWKFVPAMLSYHARVYSPSVNDLELLVQQIIFAMSGNSHFEFCSDLLSTSNQEFIQSVTVIFEEAPVISVIPDVTEKEDGTGIIYALNFEPQIRTPIGFLSEHPVIKEVNANIVCDTEDDNADPVDLQTITITEADICP